jgi:hypothetical protein
MNTENQLLGIWRQLPQTKQQEVLDFAQFLAERRRPTPSTTPNQPVTQPSALGERLQAIRDQIVASGMPLLTHEDIEREMCDRRGGYQE